MRTVWSQDAEAMREPSGLNVRDVMTLPWPRMMAIGSAGIGSAGATFHKRTVLSG